MGCGDSKVQHDPERRDHERIRERVSQSTTAPSSTERSPTPGPMNRRNQPRGLPRRAGATFVELLSRPAPDPSSASEALAVLTSGRTRPSASMRRRQLLEQSELRPQPLPPSDENQGLARPLAARSGGGPRTGLSSLPSAPQERIELRSPSSSKPPPAPSTNRRFRSSTFLAHQLGSARIRQYYSSSLIQLPARVTPSRSAPPPPSQAQPPRRSSLNAETRAFPSSPSSSSSQEPQQQQQPIERSGP